MNHVTGWCIFRKSVGPFEINSPAGKLPSQLREKSGHWNGYELVGMLKKNTMILQQTLSY